MVGSSREEGVESVTEEISGKDGSREAMAAMGPIFTVYEA
jgi:hypothetical protein